MAWKKWQTPRAYHPTWNSSSLFSLLFFFLHFFGRCCVLQIVQYDQRHSLSRQKKNASGLAMCYFVYKVITNKVFKNITHQLLGWWIPFPQWKHASAEASNFLSCTPPKLQCRDCLVINRACTVPSLCGGIQQWREWTGGGGSVQSSRLQTLFSVFIAVVPVPPSSSYTQETKAILNEPWVWNLFSTTEICQYFKNN